MLGAGRLLACASEGERGIAWYGFLRVLHCSLSHIARVVWDVHDRICSIAVVQAVLRR